ncbi:MAG: phosphodiester glycosidase family protein [Rhodobacteraceae bacterium]|nr:phosphodiester glycosidase family protein [Paracoccaceae bacterium]
MAVILWIGTTAHGLAAACEKITFEELPFTICQADAAKDDLRLFLADQQGDVFGQFSAVNNALEPKGQQLGFAMNAGMYLPDRSPVGHFVENGKALKRLLTGPSGGNFGLLPNGVFCIQPSAYRVIETLRYADEAPDCTFATQSGPMLVIDGALHPRLLPDGTSRFIRNGVGTSADGLRAMFAISDRVVNFHTFARLFRDVLGTPNALYFDGKVSRLYARNLNRSDFGFSVGPIVGTVEPLSN